MDNVEIAKERVYKTLLKNEYTANELSKKLGIDSMKIANYFKTLFEAGHLSKDRRYNQSMSRWLCYYKSVENKPFKAIVKVPLKELRYQEKIKKAKKEQEYKKITNDNPNLRVIRLLDRTDIPPAPRNKRSPKVYIGSTFALYDSY